MNVLTWLAIGVLFVFALNGMRRGLIRTVFATFTLVIAIIVAVIVAPKVSKFLQNTAVFDMVSERVESSLFGEEEGASSSDLSVSEQTAIIQELPLPESIRSSLLENNNSQIYNALGITAFKDYVSDYVACLIINALAMIVTFLALIVILHVIAAALNILSHLPVLHTLNKLGGFAIGLINGFIVLWIVFVAATLFSGTQLGSYVSEQINESVFLSMIYSKNFLMSVLTNLKYLLV